MHAPFSSRRTSLEGSWRYHLERLGAALALSLYLVAGTGCEEDEDDPPPSEPVEADNATLDVLPGVFPNAVDLSGTGEIEVAVLGAESLEAGDLSADEATLSDVEGKAKVRARAAGSARDVDGDGHLDAILSFSIPELKAAGVLTAETARVVLHAKTRSGATVSARDVVHDASHPVVRLPLPTGPHAVGTFEDAWTDDTREETFTSAPGDKRELKVRFWYPARARPLAQPSPYFLTWREGEFVARDAGLPAHAFGFFFPHAVRGAVLPEGDERFPLLLLSHGYGTPTAFYSGAAEELASQGYVVVAISHTRGGSPQVFPDGRVVDDLVELSPLDRAQNIRVQGVWTADARFVLDRLVALDASDPAGRFTGRLDLGRVGAFGHSFGGSTAGEASRTDARVKAGLNMDGTFHGDLEAEVHAPFLVMNSVDAGGDSSRERFFQHLRATGYDLSIQGAGHFTFSDLELAMPLVRHYSPQATAAEYGLGALDGPRSFTLVNTYLLAFFDKHLRARSTPLLDGPSAEHPEVELVVRQP
ncbi:alpha/beta hydrolase family protein [Pyxidicoccus sp. 3LG]